MAARMQLQSPVLQLFFRPLPKFLRCRSVFGELVLVTQVTHRLVILSGCYILLVDRRSPKRIVSTLRWSQMAITLHQLSRNGDDEAMECRLRADKSGGYDAWMNGDRRNGGIPQRQLLRPVDVRKLRITVEELRAA